MCKNEFIIPLGPELKELYADKEMCHSLRSLQMESVRPEMRMTEIAYVGFIFYRLCSVFFDLSKFLLPKRMYHFKDLLELYLLI